jgi:hypothetical protein
MAATTNPQQLSFDFTSSQLEVLKEVHESSTPTPSTQQRFLIGDQPQAAEQLVAAGWLVRKGPKNSASRFVTFEISEAGQQHLAAVVAGIKSTYTGTETQRGTYVWTTSYKPARAGYVETPEEAAAMAAELALYDIPSDPAQRPNYAKGPGVGTRLAAMLKAGQPEPDPSEPTIATEDPEPQEAAPERMAWDPCFTCGHAPYRCHCWLDTPVLSLAQQQQQAWGGGLTPAEAVPMVACMAMTEKPYQREQKDWYTTTPARPTIVCLCGSTRFRSHFEAANLEETLAGKIVLQPGHYTHSVAPQLGDKELYFSPEVAAGLEELYLRKIELADEVLVLNPGGYLGSSTRKEIDYALQLGKVVRWLEAPCQE